METGRTDKHGNHHYNKVAEAINYINTNFKDQPTLEVVAESVNLSPFHFQRLFKEWAGTTPKKFLQYITSQYTKRIIREDMGRTLFDTAHQAGLSGPSRLHDLFISIQGMTPAEYKNGGKNLVIRYDFRESPFGKLLIASTQKGVCSMAFAEDEEAALDSLMEEFPSAKFHRQLNADDTGALSVFRDDWSDIRQVKLHLKGSDFQLHVWKMLLKIPVGNLSTYGSIADKMGRPKASRAVGSAVGKNPVAYLIPCHRVIRSTGEIGNYMWGETRKTAMIGWEGVKVNMD